MASLVRLAEGKVRVLSRGLSVPAIKEVKAPSEGFLSLIFGSSQSKTESTPLDLPLANFVAPEPAYPDKEPAIETTTLENGASIVSKDVPGPRTCLGVYIDAGSVNESPYTPGVVRLLDAAALKSSCNRSSFRITRELEAIGAKAHAVTDRETMTYTVQCLKSRVSEATELLLDVSLNPRFNAWEMKEAASKLKKQLAVEMKNPDMLMYDGITSAAFSGPLSNKVSISDLAMDSLSAGDCVDFYMKNVTGPRVVLAAAGGVHAQVANVAQPLLSQLSSEPGAVAPPSKYTGGDWRHSANDMTNVNLFFDANCGWKDIKKSTTCVLLQFLMLGGFSFSTGGPGKGMLSRLYTRALSKYEWLQQCQFSADIYKNHGLMGIRVATADPARAGDAVAVAVHELQELAKGGTTDAELARAKAQMIAKMSGAMEASYVIADDLGRQQLAYGKNISLAETIAEIHKITLEDVSKTASAMLKTPLTMASYGNLDFVPNYDEVAAKFA